MFSAEARPRRHYRGLYELLLHLPAEEMRRKKQSADLSFLHQGITFTVYGREEGTERIFPHDLLLRIFTSAEWETIARDLTQRITPLDLSFSGTSTTKAVGRNYSDVPPTKGFQGIGGQPVACGGKRHAVRLPASF